MFKVHKNIANAPGHRFRISIDPVASLSNLIALSVEKLTPQANSIEQDTDLEQIEIEFNKAINPASVSSNSVSVKASPVTQHPSASFYPERDIVTKLSVEGKKIVIKI